MRARRIGTLVVVFVTLALSVGYAEVLPPGGGSGAIFTTTPDGGIVNENVHYEAKNFVYLDGGPKQNAPPQAAGLDEGFYVFQVTDPPGKLLLSVDPARCRIVHVNAEGVIDQLMAPTDNTVMDPDGNTVFFYTGATTDNWADAKTNGKYDYSQEPCHTAEAPHPYDPAGPDDAGVDVVAVPDFYGLGRHDTNTDNDHGLDQGAIVFQLMPYGTTPNPGGVYKAWLTPIQAYLDVKGVEDLDDIPSDIKGKVKPHDCPDFCATRDPGFTQSGRYWKTDNFKVTEYYPPEVKVRKFHDLNGNGLWDEGEPEIGVDQCVQSEDPNEGDILETCGEPPQGGWPYWWTFPLDGGYDTDTFYTPWTHVAAVPGIYTAEEWWLAQWTQTAAYLDGDPSTGDGFVYDNGNPAKAVPVDVIGTPGEYHEIVFGNFQLVDVTACKYEDYDGDGDKDEAIAGWEVYLTIDGEIVDTQETGEDGCYTWPDLGPLPADSYYDVEEETPEGWTPTGAYDNDGVFHAGWTAVDFESPPQSGASYRGEFTNFENVEVTACKYEDYDGDGDKDEAIAGWEVYLTIDGEIVDTQETGEDGCYTWPDLGPLPADSYYDVEEETPEGWTPTGAYDNDGVFHAGWTAVDFESPPQSGASYRGEFTNFENGKVTACKYKDLDGDGGKDEPIVGWWVILTIDGEEVDRQQTTDGSAPGQEIGCYTWYDLGPLPEGSYYDAHEEERDGWIATSPTSVDFPGPPQSGFDYRAEFTNTPVQGCTPGFWQGGTEGGQAGGRWLWNEVEDEDWVNSGGEGYNPYIHTTGFCAFFGGCSETGDMWYYINPDMWSVNDSFHKAARSLTAAYLNASWGMAYAYTTDELMAKWAAAVGDDAALLALHTELDLANNFYYNPYGSCPISASIQ